MPVVESQKDSGNNSRETIAMDFLELRNDKQ